MLSSGRSPSFGPRLNSSSGDRLRQFPHRLHQGEGVINAITETAGVESTRTGERIDVPVRARHNIEHERGSDGEKPELQIKWR
jgi:hypothetical protein